MECLATASLDTLRPTRASLTQHIPRDGEGKEELPGGATSTSKPTDKPSLAGTGNPAVATKPLELDKILYESEVLELENGQLEESLDEGYAREASSLGVSVNQSHEATRPCETPTSESIVTVASSHLRSKSASKGSQSTGTTSHTSADDCETEKPTIPETKSRLRSRRLTLRRSLSFTEYERFLAEAQAQALYPTGGSYPLAPPTSPAPSVFSVSSKKPIFNLRHPLRRLPRFRRSQATGPTNKSCVCCCEEFTTAKSYQTLPCSHTYCRACLRVLIVQTMEDESKMPSKCCSQPITGFVIRNVLSRDEQTKFIKLIAQYSIPWKDRIFCPNPNCGEFVPKPAKIDPKHPFQVTCKRCKTRICKTCKRAAHPHDQDCPADWELDAVLHLGENKGWKRCYKCRNLVELTHGCTHITCRCKAQFCYICGAVWDPTYGCPSGCNGDAELERRRIQEEERREREEDENAKREAAEQAKAFEALNAARRSAQNKELIALRKQQVTERDVFMAFEQKQKWTMWTRHAQEKASRLGQHAEAEKDVKERHLKAAGALEDRQVSAEFELRQTFNQERNACLIRLRHMEAYCDALNSTKTTTSEPSPTSTPVHTVTETNLRELAQQYNLRDTMDCTHQSRINILRERQAQQLEALAQRQEDECAKLHNKFTLELEKLEQRFEEEEARFEGVFRRRGERLAKRWGVVEGILRAKLEARDGMAFGPLPVLLWPDAESPTALASPAADSK
ncbi:MAG: hypothetical protein M1839_000649 [Geoglossum umbratile]|nr:MAG: hypothetical protein M1839_000649 [Geoglossum umbratile]